MKKLYVFYFLPLVLSCKETQKKVDVSLTRDSIMKQYFKAVDSLYSPDTLDPQFKLLKAYHDNDTNYLKKSFSEVVNLLEYQKQMLKYHTCDEIPPINTLNGEEAYRFEYNAAFCYDAIVLTIIKYTDSIVLDLYLNEIDNGQTGCKTISHTKKTLTSSDWLQFTKGLELSDFWGLKGDNGRFGFDGSNLLITGYEKPNNAFKGQYKKIHRWSADYMAVGKLFKQLLKLSDVKVNCFLLSTQ